MDVMIVEKTYYGKFTIYLASSDRRIRSTS